MVDKTEDISKIVGEVKALAELMKSGLATEVTLSNNLISEINRLKDLQAVHIDRIDKLYHVVLIGNGTESLNARVRNLERSLNEADAKIVTLTLKLEESQKSVSNLYTRLTVLVAVLSTIFGLLGKSIPFIFK